MKTLQWYFNCQLYDSDRFADCKHGDDEDSALEYDDVWNLQM